MSNLMEPAGQEKVKIDNDERKISIGCAMVALLVVLFGFLLASWFSH